MDVWITCSIVHLTVPEQITRTQWFAVGMMISVSK